MSDDPKPTPLGLIFVGAIAIVALALQLPSVFEWFANHP